MHQHLRGIVLKIIALMLFALMDAFLKQLSYTYSPIQVTFFRGIAALPFISMMVIWKGAIPDLKTPYWRLHLTRGVLGVIMLISFIYAFSEMKFADVYAIYYAAPLLVTALSVIILKESVGKHRWLAIAIGMTTVLIMMRPDINGFSWPAMAALLSTILYAVLVIIMKVLHKHASTVIQSFYFTLAVAVGAGLCSIASWHPLQWSDAWLIIGLGLNGAAAQYVMTEAYRQSPASLLAPYEYTALIWGIGFGFLFWREIPTLGMMLGAIVVALTGLYILYRERLHANKGDVVIHPPEIDKA